MLSRLLTRVVPQPEEVEAVEKHEKIERRQSEAGTQPNLTPPALPHWDEGAPELPPPDHGTQ